MPQPIPLRSALGVEQNHIVVHRPRGLVLDMVVEDLTIEEGMSGFTEWPVERHSLADLDLLGCCELHRLVGEQIQAAELVGCAKQPPGVTRRTVLVQGQRIERRQFDGHFAVMMEIYGNDQCIRTV